MIAKTWPMYDEKRNTWTVEPPDFRLEDEKLYYEYVPERWKRHFDHRPARPTVAKYLSMKPGYPIKKNGPYVAMPCLIKNKRPYTSPEAMNRFFELVDRLEKDNGINSVRP